MDKLKILLHQLEASIPKQELINVKVSKASVGWHIEHILLTIDVVIENLQNSDPKNYQWKFSFLQTIIFATKKIPRGKVQSPTAVQPKTICNPENLKHHIDRTGEKINLLPSLQPNKYFEHPFFGKLNVKPSVKFLLIHTKHHLHIIRDILQTTN
jgi:hypothetical protein